MHRDVVGLERPQKRLQLSLHRRTRRDLRQERRKRNEAGRRVEHEAERAAVVPDHLVRGRSASTLPCAETPEDPPFGVAFEQAADRLADDTRIGARPAAPPELLSAGHHRHSARRQCWNPVIPGSKPMPPPGGKSFAELNSFRAWTLMSEGNPCFDAMS